MSHVTCGSFTLSDYRVRVKASPPVACIKVHSLPNSFAFKSIVLYLTQSKISQRSLFILQVLYKENSVIQGDCSHLFYSNISFSLPHLCSLLKEPVRSRPNRQTVNTRFVQPCRYLHSKHHQHTENTQHLSYVTLQRNIIRSRTLDDAVSRTINNTRV